jgi:hypothetical protein
LQSYEVIAGLEKTWFFSIRKLGFWF